MKGAFFVLYVFFTAVAVRGQVVIRDSLIAISKSEFERGTLLSKKRFFDGECQKGANGKLVISNCRQVFIDDTTDEGFVKYDYVGDLDKTQRYKVVRETEYNGETYQIVDTKFNCESVRLLGEPQMFDNLIVNSNESVTTDRPPIVEVWKIEHDGIRKIASINLRRFFEGYLDVIEFRVSSRNKVLFKNFDGKYWRIN